MPTPTVRHREVVAAVSSGRFTAIRDRQPIKPKARPAPRATRDALARATALTTHATRDAIAATGTVERMGESLDRLTAGLRIIANSRRTVRDADAACAARAERSSPASIQAANQARWPRR